jgi:LysM repeat protein
VERILCAPLDWNFSLAEKGMRSLITTLVAGALVIFFSTSVRAQSLNGSRSSVARQASEARRHDFSYMETGVRVSRFIDTGLLERLEGNRDYELHGVSWPYARPAVRLFVERLSSQFRSGCGETLTITSLTRPVSEQPSNSSADSVHPTGMAVDLRVPQTRACRDWLNSVLLSLEGAGVLEATRENNPPHYHVAVFPNAYESYVATRGRTPDEYIVRRGDSLISIARKTGTTVLQLRAANGISGDLIRAGQTLSVPTEASLQAAETVHRVRRGESLTVIARLYGTTVAAIRAANDLTGDFIRDGEVLRVTAAGVSVP